MTASDGRLAALLQAVHEAMDAADAPLPAPEPDAGASTAQWRADVAHARALADERALQHREIVDRVSTDLFGATVADLLPPVGPLTRRSVRVAVPPDPQLADLLGTPAPRGPGARVPETESSVHVSVTTPADPQAVIIRLHGGAFWMAGGPAADRIDAHLIDQLAHTARAVVLNVDYRLAPEHPFPAAIVDTLSVLDAVRADALGLPNPGAPIALVGTSSGANIAVASAIADALRAPQAGLRGLALIVPSLLLTRAPHGESAGRRRGQQLRGYLGTLPVDDPWVSPGVLPRLAGMPQTFAAIAAHDEVAAGGEQLCAAIRAGGGRADGRVYEMTHTIAAPFVEAAMIADVAAAVADALAG